MKQQKNLEFLFIAIIILFTVIQLSFYAYNAIFLKKNETDTIVEADNEIIKFSAMNNELKEVDNIDVKSINYNTTGWKIEIALNGDSNTVINSLNKLNNIKKYTINKYDVLGKDGFFTIKLDLYRKK